MTSVPERADGVDDKTRGQIVSASDFRFTRLATAECPALREKLRSSGAMNGAIDSAAAKQRRIGRVHNCIDGECGNIAANDVDLDIHIAVHAITMASESGVSVFQGGSAAPSGDVKLMRLRRLIFS